MIWSRKLLALLLGSVAAGAISGQASARPDEATTPIQRLHAIRAVYLASLRATSPGDIARPVHAGETVEAAGDNTAAEAANGKAAGKKLAQWGNFPNFPNFPNWNNWNNWFNGWMNY